MLKLERANRSDQLNVLLRPKPKILTRPFLMALSYALFFHLMALFIFQIAPLKIDYALSILPQVRVASESFDLNRNYIADLSIEEENPAFYLMAPLPKIPSLPTLQHTTLLKNIEYIKQNNPLNNPFLALEKTFDWQINLEGMSDGLSPLIQLSGSLASLPFEYKGSTAAFKNDQIHSTTYHFLYHVQLDPKKGELFWWDLKKGDRYGHAQKHAVDILKNLIFEVVNESVPIFGEVSLSFVL